METFWIVVNVLVSLGLFILAFSLVTAGLSMLLWLAETKLDERYRKYNPPRT